MESAPIAPQFDYQNDLYIIGETNNGLSPAGLVEAKYPRIDQPYHYSNERQLTVPCDHAAENAAYELTVKLNRAQAEALWNQMVIAYAHAKQSNPSWPDQPKNTFKNDEEDGYHLVKTRKKAAYGGQPSEAPKQYDATRAPLAADFQLTRGSKVKAAVKLVPYSNTQGPGVSLRLMSVQVVDLAPRQDFVPFAVEDAPPIAPSNANEFDDNPFGSSPSKSDDWGFGG